MLGLYPTSYSNAVLTLEAASRSLAMVEFGVNGRVMSANENFSKLLGYGTAEIKGVHHSAFVDVNESKSAEYTLFWERLRKGEYITGEFKRYTKAGEEIWIRGSYNPVSTAKGKVIRVVKIASDVTRAKTTALQTEAKMTALSRSQAMIEFAPDGTILAANENFLSTMGYNLSELVGRHHSIFVRSDYRDGEEYRSFWRRLSSGEYISSEFLRVGKDGREVWILASYNPIFDLTGRVCRVVKIATDVSQRVKAVNAITAGLSRLAESDLKHRIEIPFGSGFERLRADYNRSLDVLEATMQKIGENTEAIFASSAEISEASDDLSQRTEKQAANLEETAAALDIISTTMRKAADGADHARQVVVSTNDDAANSVLIVRDAVNAMDLIADSSRQISQIIGVIDEIAFQTNLLALNAGVEAARAGEAGRGFAVVASEVRALAQRSAEAAKEIKGHISRSTGYVENGVKLVAATGASLERIVDRVNEVNIIMADIASGAKEQAASLSEINTAIGQMDRMTQQNAAMAEESTAASHSLRGKADELAQLVRVFEVSKGGGVAGAAREQRLVPSPVARPSSRRPRVMGNTALKMAKDAWTDF